MLSRVANSIYWMNRYVERAENYARFIGVNFNLILDMPPAEKEQWKPLLIASGDDRLFAQNYEAPDRDAVLHFMSFDSNNPNSILSCISKARENARSVREVISKEMWEHINHCFHGYKSLAQSDNWKMDEWQEFFSRVKMDSQLFYGIIDSTITRSEGWHFGRMGRFLERADKTSRFIDVKYYILLPSADAVGTNYDQLQWSALLKSVSAFNMYRQHFRSINPADILAFLVLDRQFPRSIYYCIREAERSLYVIAGNQTKGNLPIKVLGKLRADLEYLEENEIFEFGLHEFMDRFQQRNNAVGDAIHESYFALKQVPANARENSGQ